jgi:hypothetical protein
MSFNTFSGNSQHNLYLDQDCPEKLDAIEIQRPVDFVGESVPFIHEWKGAVCLYTGSAVQAYSQDLSQSKLIGSLPPGDSVLFTETGPWVSHVGPVRKYDLNLKSILEEIIIPHGGAWTSCLGFFRMDIRMAVTFAFSGGPRKYAPELHINFVKEEQTPEGLRLVVSNKIAAPGETKSVVQLKDLLFCAGKFMLSIYTFDGALHQEIPLTTGLVHTAASEKLGVIGGFSKIDGRCIYREFDSNGQETFSYPLSGAEQPGHIVFDPEGSRYLMSEKKLIKLGADGQRVWSHSLLGKHSRSPKFIVYREGRCAYVDDRAFVRLDADGVETHRIPLTVKRIVSPPYLDSKGAFWFGLANQGEKVLRVKFKT